MNSGNFFKSCCDKYLNELAEKNPAPNSPVCCPNCGKEIKFSEHKFDELNREDNEDYPKPIETIRRSWAPGKN